ncbi:MAG: sulfoxide reductase heme-binding subunit YedZ [Alphaproteobacteria bacterium GM7ARS4]|nr:sulfoxide reductase heme-binding subunit YedZ [Alphaproteobacteria bacterium GM7ARS4]
MAARAKGFLWHGVFWGCSMPAVILLMNIFTGNLGADPAKTLSLETGIWALNFLLLCLCMSPFSKYLRMPRLVSYRRQLGLWCYFYVCLHVLVFVSLLIEFNIANLGKELAERPYILVGFMGWVGLSIMAVTSLPRLIRWMGAKNWRRLHKIVFAVVVFACVHYLWLSRSDIFSALLYSLLFLGLIGMRLYYFYGGRRLVS